MKKLTMVSALALSAAMATSAQATTWDVGYSFQWTTTAFGGGFLLTASAVDGSIEGAATAPNPGTPILGNGTFDDVSGVLTLGAITYDLIGAGDAVHVNGSAQTGSGSVIGTTVSAMTFAVNAGTLACVDPAGAACTGFGGDGAPASAYQFDVLTFDMFAAGGVGTAQWNDTRFIPALNGDADTVHNLQVILLNESTPEVPLPAAAWLFGSGLIGLAGVARRKRS